MTASYVRQGYVVIPNNAVHDRGLDLAALGMLAYLLALPPGASSGYRELCKALGCGERVVRRCLAALAAGGYRHVVRYQRPDGTWRSVAVHGPEPMTPEEARNAALQQSGDLAEALDGVPAKRRHTVRAKRPLGVTSGNSASSQVAPSGRLPRHGERPHVPTGLTTPTGNSRARGSVADVLRCDVCGFLAPEPDHADRCGDVVSPEPTPEFAAARAALAASRQETHQ